MISEDWWPDLLGYMRDENPWALPRVVVAEQRSYDDEWVAGDRIMWSALVPASDIGAVESNLAGFSHGVDASGPNPTPVTPGSYQPTFRISHYSDEHGRREFEPLVLGWQANNRTAMVLDPGFAMTYGLMPRVLPGGKISWDDVETPEPDIATVDIVSAYRDLRSDRASTSVSKDHLQDYLTLRDMVLVQVYYEKRSGPTDPAAEALMSDGYLDLAFPDRQIDVRRVDDMILAQAWGARIIARPGPSPISSNILDEQGLLWPGRDVALTRREAGNLRPGQAHAYIRDEVLSGYMAGDGFRVHPSSGSVRFEGQWSVHDCRRIGRDLIEVDLRSLHTSARPSVVRHWHGFAVDPPPRTGPFAVTAQDPNVATRAAAVVREMETLGRALKSFADRLGLSVEVEDLIGFSPEQVEYEGWWTQPFLKQIARPYPLTLGRDAFLGRCLDLDKVVNEALGKKALYRIVAAFGEQKGIKDLRSLKLLDRILCLTEIAERDGLHLVSDREIVLRTLNEEEAMPLQPVSRLFALSDFRQVAAHRKDLRSTMPEALARFGADIAETMGGWGATLDTVYDKVVEDLRRANRSLSR